MLPPARTSRNPKGNGCNLFAYPAQSNASGVKHDLKWIEIAQREGFHVLLDAAAFVTTSKLDLSRCKPDFVCVSFYKIFGYPTGVGCLLIKKSSFHLLTKVWFAGGTVNLASVVSQHKFLKEGCERFEDGTLNYNNIPAIETGLKYIESIGLERISRRIATLTQYLVAELKSVVHDTGQPLVKIFGPESFDNRGGNVMMNFSDPLGNVYSFEAIELITNANCISIRSGCFCNPGIDEINHRLRRKEILQFFQSRQNGDYNEMKSFLGKRRGATRTSVGLPTNKSDIDAFVTLIKSLKNKVLKQPQMATVETLVEI
jgi:molybdenum cofactor sulfurtransferase